MVSGNAERMAEWLTRWTRDLEVLGLLSSVVVLCKNLGHALNPHRLCLPSRYGYQVKRKLILCE